MLDPTPPPVPFLLRLWAWLTAAAALPLAVLGAEVTTRKVGLVDREGLRSPLHLFAREADVPGQPLRLMHLVETRNYGQLIEHGHRTAGWVVGLFALVLCVGMLFWATGWRRWLGVIVLAAVSVQGVLGIFRVSRISTELAAMHGCVAQLVFATLVGVAVLASRTWSLPAATPRPLRVGGWVLCGLVYVQIVFGALFRHLGDSIAQRLHVVLAFVVFGVATWLLGRLHRRSADVANPASRRLSFLLAVLIVLQPILGVEAWLRLARHQLDAVAGGTLPELLPSDPTTNLIRSAHHLMGTLIFMTTAALAILLCRPSPAPVTWQERHPLLPTSAAPPTAIQNLPVLVKEGSA